MWKNHSFKAYCRRGGFGEGFDEDQLPAEQFDEQAHGDGSHSAGADDHVGPLHGQRPQGDGGVGDDLGNAQRFLPVDLDQIAGLDPWLADRVGCPLREHEAAEPVKQGFEEHHLFVVPAGRSQQTDLHLFLFFHDGHLPPNIISSYHSAL